MAAPILFTLWNKKDYQGNESKYYQAQGASGIMLTNSLKTFEGAWVIIFNKNDYDPKSEGDYLKIGPKISCPDLQKVPKGSAHNWRNDIKSFILYTHEPSWWQQSERPSYDALFDVPDGQVWFMENDDFQGSNVVFDAPNSVVNCYYSHYASGEKMDDLLNSGNISSLKTGERTWLVVFEDKNGSGAGVKMNPGTTYMQLSDLKNVSSKEQEGQDWDNRITSFFLYAKEPEFWKTYYPGPMVVPETLVLTYPDSELTKDGLKYIVEDAEYKITQIEVLRSAEKELPSYHGSLNFEKLPENGWANYHVELKHGNIVGDGDKARMDLVFANDGTLNAIQNFYWVGHKPGEGEAWEIDDAFITAVDITLSAISWAGGITKVVAEGVQKAFDLICGLFNRVCDRVYKLTDDGGRYYFLPVVCHTVNRISSNVFKHYDYQLYKSSSDPRIGHVLSFNWNSFPYNFPDRLNAGDWLQLTEAKGSKPYNQVVNMGYGNFQYRTWYQEVSLSSSLGLIVSCKIDYVKEGKDDHIILIMGFTIPSETSPTLSPVLIFAQATIQFTDGEHENIMSDIWTKEGSVQKIDGVIIPAESDDIVENLFLQLRSTLWALKFSPESNGRVNLADITKANMNAIIASTIFSVPTN